MNRRFPYLAVGVWLIGFQIVHAEDFEGRKIESVTFVPAAQPLDPVDLERLQPIKPGQPFSREQVAKAIDQLFSSGRFDDIRVEAESIPGGGVAVRFVTENRWFTGHVGLEGKVPSPPNVGQVVNATQLDLGTLFTEDAVKTAESNLRRLFDSNGLHEATFQPQIVRDPDAQEVHLTFVVHAGKRARYIDPVITGDAKLPNSTIVRATGWKVRFIGRWRQVTEGRTRNGVIGIQNAYSKKDRLMAKVELKSLDYDPVKRREKASVEVAAGPKVEVKAIEEKVSKRNLKKYVPVYQERRVDRDLLVEGARNLRDFFQTQGYYDADIDFRQQPESNDEVVVEYVISKGPRYKLTKVDVEGNRYFKLDTIRERMFLQPAGFVRFRHGRYSEALRKKDEQNIENLYKANGYRDVKVVSLVDRGTNGRMDVKFQISEGPQWYVDSLKIQGNSKLDPQLLQSRLSSIEGQPFSEVNVAADRASILTLYQSRGYPQASFQWEAKPALEANHVELIYRLTEGEQRFVRDVLITGVKVTRPNLVQKRIVLKKDEPLSLVALTQGQRNLYDSGVLAKVNAAIQNPGSSERHKFVLYDIEEAARYNLNVGVGAEFARLGGTATSLDTPAGTTGFSPRVSIDISRLNMFGLGHYATLRGRVSTLQKRASIDYVAPRFLDVDGRNITFTILYDDSRDVRTFQSRREEASVQMSQKFSKATTGLFRYTIRRVETSNVVIPTLLVPQLLQPVRLGLLSANIAQDRRDNPADATRGIFNTLDVSVSSRYFGSNRSFGRALARNATYHRLTRDIVLARETTLGVIVPFSVPAGISAADSIPLPERFFAGGSTSHRGFPENQAGPRDIGQPAAPGAPATEPTGFPLGGNAMFFNLTELRFPLIGDNIRGVFFHDMGNIFRSIGDVSFRFNQRDNKDFNYMVHAVGFGVRYKTPIGPVRGDLAYSINPPRYVGFKGTPAELLGCDPSKPATGVCVGVPQRISHFQFFFSIGQTF